MFKSLCLGALFSLTVLSQVSAEPNIVYVDIGPCLAMEADTERHECYVSLGEHARSALPPAADSVSPTIPVAAREDQQESTPALTKSLAIPTVQTTEEFGLRPPAAAAQEMATARVLANANGDQELVGTIAQLDERRPNMWDVTLSNDQVWRQINSDVYRLQEGMEIRIYPSPFAGSFRMSAKGKNGFIQVRRIR